MLNFSNQLVVNLTKWLHVSAIEDDKILVKFDGYTYPIVTFLALSDKKIAGILEQLRFPDADIHEAFICIRKLRLE